MKLHCMVYPVICRYPCPKYFFLILSEGLTSSFYFPVSLMVVRMRHTSSKTHMRRSHHAISMAVLSKCSRCGRELAPHTMCQNCGYYNGRQVIDVLAKLNKKERKKKEKELHAHEEEKPVKEKALSAEELSHR